MIMASAKWRHEDLWLVLKRRGLLSDRLATFYCDDDDTRCLNCTHPIQDVLDIINYCYNFNEAMPQATKVHYTLGDALHLIGSFVHEYKRSLGYLCTCPKHLGLQNDWCNTQERLRIKAETEAAANEIWVGT